MSVLFWILLAVGSAFLMMASSRFAINNSVAVAENLNISPFIIGITLVAVGTDAPEIINSIISSYLGKGDINVGDSIGSVFTQSSLVLGLFPFITGVPIMIEKKEILTTAILTVLALLAGMYLMNDSSLGHLDGIILVVLWLVTSFIAWKFQISPKIPMKEISPQSRKILTHIILALAAFGVVGIAASGLIKSIVALSTRFGVPEYILSFFGASLGTSLPELAVEFAALRRNQRQLALGDVFGSCLVDATLSIGIGPLIFSNNISSTFALRGSTMAIIAILIPTLILSLRKKHDRLSGSALIVLYLAAYFFIIQK